ncbi:autotransporter-associated beta strand repeat-containing protein [Variovorax sp. GT1P44]|uniref:autotransporter-associated beta strand repeat-containing protein n=1 Tax=Variovorax sp. GT1P44 TaxID=3443742 RepID=UPI003F44893D
MNKIFSIVWSAHQGRMVVASESAKRTRPGPQGASCAAAVGAAVLLFAHTALADGLGGSNAAALGGNGAYGAPGGGGGTGGVGGTGNGNVAAGANGSSGNGGAGSLGSNSTGGTPGTPGAGGSVGSAANPIGGNGGDAGDAVCDTCTAGLGASGGGGGGDGFNGITLDGVSSPIIGGNGGNGGSALSASASGADGGSGGGAGAGAVIVGGGSTSTRASITGGTGGNGGNALGPGGAGFGGGGGSGLVINAVDLTNAFTIQGGNGGNGGNGAQATHGRSGGTGGAGITGTSLAVSNSGVIQGGNGGATGLNANAGAPGAIAVGGAGVQGTNVQILNSGTIAGGMNGNGTVRANAISFTGGVNSLTLLPGWNITGNVVGSGGSTNTLILGGNTTDLSSDPTGASVSTIFSVSQIGLAYLGFSSFQKTGASTWQLTGTTASSTPWTIAGGTLQIGSNGALGGAGSALTQAAGSTLNVALGSTHPVISATNASLDGTLNVTGFSASVPSSASALAGTQFNFIHTTGGIANDFATVTLGGAASPVDYLTLEGSKSADSLDYNVGFGLTWQAARTPGNGVFTIAAPADTFNVDVVLSNQTAVAATGWDGAALTKNGAGTLVLSAANTYTGQTLVNAGTLQAGIADAFASSGAVDLASGATLDLKNFNQTANNLAGAGSVVLGSAELTANNTADTTFSGGIGGAGNVIKTGTGALTLTGDNTYAGGTAISAGTLQIGEGGTTGSITGNVTDDGILAFNRSDAVIFTGAISGSGAVEQRGGGTTTLTADNTYAGGTTITAGTLQLGSGGTAGSITGNVTDNGVLAFNRSDTVAFAGTISGSGSVHQMGGTTVLSAANTYTGGTTISGGTVSVGADANLGAAAGGLTLDGGTLESTASFTTARGVTITGNNGTVQTDAGTTLTTTGAVAGTGAFTKNGAGTLVLAADNTYAGGTTIGAGTLQLGSGGTTGSITGNVTDNGVLAFNRSDAIAFAGSISGSGAVNQMGAGATTLTAANTYTGGTTITAGTLQLGNGGTTGSITGNVTDNGTLAFNRSDAVTFAGTITGSGSLTQAGTGVTTLTGTGSSVASASVAAGTLNLAQAGAFTTTGGYTTATGAITQIAADSTLNVGGALTQAAGSTLNVALGSTQPVISATSASLDGTLNVTGLRVPDTASALPGTLSNVIHTTAGITNDFAAVTLGGAVSPVDYLTLAGGKSADSLDYNVGLGMTWTAGSALGNGTFTLANAASTFNADVALADQASSSTGWDGRTLTKDGAGTLVLSAANTYTGATQINAGTLQGGITNAFANSSAVNIASGATLDLNNFDQIANNLAGAGNVTLGTAALTANNTADTAFSGGISGAGRLVKAGGAALTLTGDNTYTGGTTISEGTLRLGDGGTTGSIAGDIRNDAALVVNRSDALTLGGVISGSGSLTQAGPGTTTLNGANTYSGATNVAAGTFKAGAANAFSANSAHTVASGATLDTGGFNQTVASLDNAGTVNLLSATPGSSLTVTGAYVGRGGTLRLGTALGDSASASDRLVLDGPGASASGTTNLQVTNLAGLGALTSGNGIEVISARNGATTTAQTTKDAFVLAGGVTVAGAAKGGRVREAPHIDAGAYEYRLYAADASGAGENWYLRSTTDVVAPPAPPPPVGEVAPPPPPPVVVPTYRAEVPMVAALSSQSRQGDAAMLGNLHRRMGDDDVTREATGATPNQLDRRAWGRAVYTDVDVRQQGIAQAGSNGSLSGFQAGMDLWSDPSWRAGLYAGLLQGGVDVSGNAHGEIGHVGSNRLQSRYLGGYATWTDRYGRYADIVLQGGSHRYDLRPDGNPQVSGKGSSLTASVEAGQPFAIAEGWTIEPQAQLGYQKSSFDDLQLGGALVQQQIDAGWFGRLGVRVKGDMMTSVGRLQPYGRLNLYFAGSGTDVARFVSPAAVTEVPTRTGYTSAEVAAGMTLALNPSTSLYGEVGRVFDVSGNARVRSSVQGTVGIRVRWD